MQDTAYPSKAERHGGERWYGTATELSDGHLNDLAADDHEDREDIARVGPLASQPRHCTAEGAGHGRFAAMPDTFQRAQTSGEARERRDGIMTG